MSTLSTRSQILTFLNRDKPVERVVEILEWHSFKINEMVQRAHAFRQNEEFTSAFSHMVEKPLLTKAEYDRAHLLFMYSKSGKTPVHPQSNEEDSAPKTVNQDEDRDTSFPGDSTTSTSAQVQSVSVEPAGPIDTDVRDPTMTQVEQALLDTSISPEDVPSYKTPATSVPTQQPTALQPSEITIRVPNEKMDKALLAAAGQGHTEMMKMLIAKGGDLHFDITLEKDTPLCMAALNGKIETLDYICDTILLKDPLGVHRTLKDGDSILHLVCAGLDDAIEMIDHLVTHRGFDIEQPGRLGMRPLHYAAVANNVKLVEHLIVKHKVDVHAVDDGKSTALHTAAYRGYLEAIIVLLNHGADIHAWNTEDDQPIHCAALENHTEAVGLLLDRGAHLEDTDDGKRILTPIYCAIKSGKIETLKLLISRGADPTFGKPEDQPIHFAGDIGTPEQMHVLLTYPGVSISTVSTFKGLNWNAFHHTCWAGNLPAMKCMVELGADISLRDGDSTPLYICAQRGKLECVDYLLSISPILACEKVVAPDEFPLLHMVATKGYLDIMKSLLAAGADPKIWTINAPLYLPIHYASQFGFTDLTLFLLDAYPSSLEQHATAEGFKLTVLGVAASAGKLATMSALAARGADVQCVSDPLLMPTIHVAARSGYANIIHLLYKAGADVEFPFDGWTPLRIAVEFSNVECIHALITCGADVERIEAGGNRGRPIHYAAAMKSSAQLEALVERGADIEAVMEGGLRPLHLAAKYGHVECVRLLLVKGADQDAKDREGKTALDLAVTLGMVGCVELLI